MAVSAQDEQRLALFIDFENIAIGVRDAHYRKFDVNLVLERLLDKVGATAGQRGQIEAIWAGLRPQLRSFHQQERSIHQQMSAALSAATINPAAVEQLRQQAMGVANQMSATFTQGLVQTAQVLTPEQRKTAAAAIAEARARFHQHHGPGMMGQ